MQQPLIMRSLRTTTSRLSRNTGAMMHSSPCGLRAATRPRLPVVPAAHHQQEPEMLRKLSMWRQVREGGALVAVVVVAIVNWDRVCGWMSPTVSILLGKTPPTEEFRSSASALGLLGAAVLGSWTALEALWLRVDEFFTNIYAIPSISKQIGDDLHASYQEIGDNLHASYQEIGDNLHASYKEIGDNLDANHK